MKPDLDMLRVKREILIGGEDGDAVTMRYRAEQKIRIGALNALRPQGIEKLCASFKILPDYREIFEVMKIAANAIKGFERPKTAQNLLPNGS